MNADMMIAMTFPIAELRDRNLSPFPMSSNDDLAKRMIELAGYEPGEEIKIEYTGLRPGEKLYEEVLSNTENTIPTTHDRIRIAKVREYDYAEACAATGQLEQFARMVNVPDTVCLMKKIVPEFKSKNSEFERFDKVQPA